MTITPEQLDLLHHTLGVTPKRREPYRNHFVAGDGHYALTDLEALEAAGLMARGHTPSFCDKGDIVFLVTPAGRECALDCLPQPPKRTRYGEYLDSEYSESFADWLGINLPRLESNCRYGKDYLCRYVRSDYYGNRVVGEWAATKKDAKASYKRELNAHRGSEVPA